MISLYIMFISLIIWYSFGGIRNGWYINVLLKPPHQSNMIIFNYEIAKWINLLLLLLQYKTHTIGLKIYI